MGNLPIRPDGLSVELRAILSYAPPTREQVLQGWIDLHDHAAGLYERMVAIYENADPTTLLPGFEQMRADHFASLVDERDRYRKGAEEGRALQRQLDRPT